MPPLRTCVLCLLPVNRTWAAAICAGDTGQSRRPRAGPGRARATRSLAPHPVAAASKLSDVPASRAPAARPRRRSRLAPAAAAALAAVALAAAGCASFDRAFGQQEAVVQFQPQTSNAARLKVRAACSHVPQATPEPLPTSRYAAIEDGVGYRVDNASDGDLARLQQCLQRFKSVVGIEFNGPDGS